MANVPLIWVHELLGKAVIKRASTLSGAAFTEEASVGFDRAEYILRVLKAPQSTRYAVKNAAIALANSTDSPGYKQLVCILVVFEALSSEQKEAFILAYRGTTTLTTQGAREIVRNHTWDDGHLPPRQEP